MKRWIRRFDDLNHRLNCSQRISRLLAIILDKVPPHISGRLLIVCDPRLRDHPGAAEKIGSERAWLNHRDVDSQRRKLRSQSLRKPLDSELCRVVHANALPTDQAADR